jgi:hypothetical protein
MVSASTLLLLAQAQTFVLSGRLHEIDADGEDWVYYPLCVKCGKMFAEPAIGTSCCVCLAANS